MIERLTSGEDIALVTERGLRSSLIRVSGWSQPLSTLEVTVVPIPGASAVLAALVAYGLDTSTFTFVGFLPRSGREREQALALLSASSHTSVLFESPTRVAATLRDLRVLDAAKGVRLSLEK